MPRTKAEIEYACPQGHLRAEHGRLSAKGHWACRACDRMKKGGLGRVVDGGTVSKRWPTAPSTEHERARWRSADIDYTMR